LKRAVSFGGTLGAIFGALFTAFYALGSWLVCSGRTTCPSSWLPYLYIALGMWAVITLIGVGGAMAAVWFYRITKV
jgi:nitrate reductase NapE component